MDFKEDLQILNPLPKNNSFNLLEAATPQPEDVFLVTKKSEIYERYQDARMFLRWTETETIKGWFKKTDSEEMNARLIGFKKKYCYELALLYYNAIIDIAWGACYACATIEKGKLLANSTSIMGANEAEEALRHFERNPYERKAIPSLSRQYPAFSDLFDAFQSFMNKPSTKTVRDSFQFIKHRGVPIYKEEGHIGIPGIKIHVNDKVIATSSSDVRKKLSIGEQAQMLKDFDEKCLYPFIGDFITKLEEVVNPSPLAMI